MSKETARILIEAGIIPKNTLQQLVNWRLVPEDFIQSHGKRKVSLESNTPEEIDSFTKELSEALTRDMSEIHETELDHAGEVESFWLKFAYGSSTGSHEDVFVDKLGRLVVPIEERWNHLTDVRRGMANQWQKVVRIEKRFSGDKETDLVIYLSETSKEIPNVGVA